MRCSMLGVTCGDRAKCALTSQSGAHDMSGVEVMRTGVPGLDDVLAGGLACGRLFLLEGEPGAGKTTVALQFLMDGAKAAEQSLYVTLSESEEELRQSAASHGWI